MSYKAYPFFRDILINECIYFASKNKKLVRLNYKSEAYVGFGQKKVWPYHF